MRGICDSCGNYSPQLEVDEYTGWLKCRKCETRTEKAVQEAYRDRASAFGGVAKLYPDERRV